MARLSNPFAFTRGPVTVITTIVYIALLAFLIVVQLELPDLPASPTSVKGINITEAWQDLQLLTAQYHPYNSHRNQFVQQWLLTRIEDIIRSNKAPSDAAYVFNDNVSNLTSSSSGVSATSNGISVYFEGTNIIVYVRGDSDDKNEWWKEEDGSPSTRDGILVNAHYDSVSTGFGSTDDGVGVVTILQLIKYFTTKGNTPKHGLVLLLNNGEEDFLNGARAFGQHPLSRLVYSFLNLEGAGAGGRAALFRSTDEEVTRSYAKSPYPFGTVISADAFSRGVVRSQTDYVVFNGNFGYRGLDVAFIGPRSRYHTSEDDSRHTGKKALWHMLSAALATTRDLTRRGLSSTTESHRSIWFDLFGRAFVLMQSHTFFALAVSLLVVGPIVLLITLAVLSKADKLYLFSSSRSVHTAEGDTPVNLNGWRGFFRFPLIMLFAGAAPIALAYLLFKENTEIIHSSPWPVWAMMISSFIFVAWFFARFADYIRPSSLTRAYGFGWICFAWWAVLIVALVHEEQVHISGVYFALFFSASAFLTTWLSYLELFSLPNKRKFAKDKLLSEGTGVHSDSETPSRPSSSRAVRNEDENEEEEATEQSSLLRSGRKGTKPGSAYKTLPREDDNASTRSTMLPKLSHDEQEWSESMWSGTWLLNLLIIVPINVVILGQIGFYLVDALHQTGQDGNSVFIVYLGVALITIFMFSPIVPMIHRLTWHVPMFLVIVLAGTIIYNLLAFPFSAQNQIKLYFQQQIDLQGGNNTVSLLGVSPYVQMAISDVPSASGQKIHCESIENREKCSWTGPTPQVAGSSPYVFSKSPYRSLLNYNASITNSGRSKASARFSISGKNTRACKLLFDSPMSEINVVGQSPEDKRLPAVPEQGSKELRLWSRTWNRTWTVDVSWDSKQYGSSLSGRAVCLWSDVNQEGTIPAFDEVKHYVPVWVAVTKAADGLVEGYKTFNISS